MAALVASPSWTQSLPYAPQHSYSSQYNSYNQRPQTPLRQSSATWNTKFPAGLSLDLSLPAAAPPRMPVYTSSAPSPSYVPAKPRLRLATSSELPSRRFDPFADEPQPVASTSALPPPSPSPSQGRQNTPPPARGRALMPLSISISVSTSTSSTPSSAGPSSPAPPQGRRRAPSFSAGSGSPRSSLSPASLSALTPSPAPSLTRATLYSSSSSSSSSASKVVEVPLAPTPFHARHYPTPDARARLLARTLLNRIHAVGRPRSLYSCSAYSKTRCGNGYESECGARGYVPSRLSECVCVA